MLLSHFCCSDKNCAFSGYLINTTMECGLSLKPRDPTMDFVANLVNMLRDRPLNFLCVRCHPNRQLVPLVVTACWSSVNHRYCYPAGYVVPLNFFKATLVLTFGSDCFLNVDIFCRLTA
jgi:hypothetical protein